MNRDRRSSSHDPTDEAAIDQSTQSAGGVGRKAPADDIVNRQNGNSTPRRYEQPPEADGDPVMPSEDSPRSTIN